MENYDKMLLLSLIQKIIVKIRMLYKKNKLYNKEARGGNCVKRIN